MSIGYILILIGELIVSGSVSHGTRETQRKKQNNTLVDLLTHICSLGIYVILLGVILIFF